MKRRDAIKYFMSGLILPLVPARLQAAAAQSGRRLVLIELSGANDGLNKRWSQYCYTLSG